MPAPKRNEIWSEPICFSAGVLIAPLCEQAGWQMSGHVLLNVLADGAPGLAPSVSQALNRDRATFLARRRLFPEPP
jgi:hypothetical protein